MTAEPTEFRWDRLTYASALSYCLLVAGLSVGIVLPELRDQFHLSGVVAALHGSTFGIGLLVMGSRGVLLIDRVGRRRAFAIATTAMISGVTLLCVGPLWQITLFGTAVSGMGGALLNMLMPGVISDHHGEHRAIAFAAVNAVPAVGGVMFSLVIGGALGAGWSWRGPFLALTGVFAVAFLAVANGVNLPTGSRQGEFTLRHLRRREVYVPFLFLINAALTEFPIGVWGVTYLREVGGASAGMAPVLATGFGISMFLCRVLLPRMLGVVCGWAISTGFVVAALGATMMCVLPGLAFKVVGVALVGFGGGVLYPLSVDRFYERAGHVMDSVSIGAYTAFASGIAVTLGPLALGVLADGVGLRWAVLIVPALGLLGAFTQRPRS